MTIKSIKKNREKKKITKEEWKYIYDIVKWISILLFESIDKFEIENEGSFHCTYTVLDYPPRIFLSTDFSGDGRIRVMEEFGVLVGLFMDKHDFNSHTTDGIPPHGWDNRKNYMLRKDAEKEIKIHESYSRSD